jgi:hypothetical protein
MVLVVPQAAPFSLQGPLQPLEEPYPCERFVRPVGPDKVEAVGWTDCGAMGWPDWADPGQIQG